MFREGPIRTKEVEVVVAAAAVVVGVTPMAVEAEEVAEEVDPTRMDGTSIMTSPEVIIRGITITIGEGVEEVVGPLTTIMAQFKAVKCLPALGLGHDFPVSC